MSDVRSTYAFNKMFQGINIENPTSKMAKYANALNSLAGATEARRGPSSSTAVGILASSLNC